MSQFKIWRTCLSTYHHPLFMAKEKFRLNSLKNIEYIEKIDPQDLSQFILLTNTSTYVKDLSSDLLSRTKLIIHTNSGYDHFSEDFIKEAKFPLICGNPIRHQGLVEYVLSIFFSETNHLPETKKWDASRQWARNLLSSKVVTLIGHGHVGRKLSKTLKSLDVKHFIIDPYTSNEENINSSLEQSILSQTDFLVLCCSLNKKNIHMIDSSILKMLPSNAVLINPARGKLINQRDLINHCLDNQHFKAYLDVFETEPFEEDQFSAIGNIIKTSHIAGCSEQLDNDIIDYEYEIIKNFLLLNSTEFAQLYHHLDIRNFFHHGMLR